MTDWAQLDAFLRTDPEDVGCDEAMRILHVYVELVANGEDPAARHPGAAAHLRECGPCGDDFTGLLALVTEPPSKGSRTRLGEMIRRRQ
jgi:hypothetical protein